MKKKAYRTKEITIQDIEMYESIVDVFSKEDNGKTLVTSEEYERIQFLGGADNIDQLPGNVASTHISKGWARPYLTNINKLIKKQRKEIEESKKELVTKLEEKSSTLDKVKKKMMDKPFKAEYGVTDYGDSTDKGRDPVTGFKKVEPPRRPAAVFNSVEDYDNYEKSAEEAFKKARQDLAKAKAPGRLSRTASAIDSAMRFTCKNMGIEEFLDSVETSISKRWLTGPRIDEDDDLYNTRAQLGIAIHLLNMMSEEMPANLSEKEESDLLEKRNDAFMDMHPGGKFSALDRDSIKICLYMTVSRLSQIAALQLSVKINSLT